MAATMAASAQHTRVQLNGNSHTADQFNINTLYVQNTNMLTLSLHI